MKSLKISKVKFITTIFLFSTALWSIQATVELQPTSDTATLKINKKAGAFARTDGLKVFSIDEDKKISGYLDVVSLSEGTHSILLQYVYTGNTVMMAGMGGGALGGAIVGAAGGGSGHSEKRLLNFIVQAGRKYQVKMKFTSHDLFVCWIEDSQTGKIVSKLQKGSSE